MNYWKSNLRKILFITIICIVCALEAGSKGKTGRNSNDFKGTSLKVRLPRGYRLPSVKRRSYKNNDIVIKLFARNFAQGNAVYLEVYSKPNKVAENFNVKNLYINNKKILISKRSWGYRGLFGIHPGTRPGRKKIKVNYSIEGISKKAVYYLKISKSAFKFYKRPLDLGKYSDVEYQQKPGVLAFIRKCTVKKKKAFSKTSKDLFGSDFSHPRNMHYITSPFWATRLVMRYRKRRGRKRRLKNKVNIHRGLDFRGKTGTPIYSLADGRVALAEPMYYEGNFIIIDHGNRIFSYFMHLSKFKVKRGDIIRGGDIIGFVGSTGITTASHLHLSLMINGVQVNPLSLLPLPFRD